MRFKQLRKLICAGMLGSSILFCGVSEAGVVTDRLPLQCYADHQVNTYNTPGAAKRAGYISANVDLIKITQVRGDGWCYGSYPGAGGKRVSRWFRITDVCADAGYTNRSANVRGKQTVYRTRSGGATLGSVSNNEGVIVVADNGSRAQIVYRLDNGTGYKLGWVPSSAVARVATPTPAPVVNPVVRPQTDTYVSPAEGDYYLLPEADSGYALDVAGGGDAPEQTILQLYHKNNTDAQIFHIKRISGEWHIIQHKRTGRVANCQWGGNSNGTRLWLYHYDGTASCHWRFIKQNNDSYLIQSQLSGNPIMELQNNNVYAQGRIQLWNRHSGQAGRWKLVRVQAAPPQPVVQEQAGYIKTSGANLYFRQSPNGTILGKLSNNTPVTVLQHPATNGWSKVRYNGTTGYVSSQYVAIGIPPTPNPAPINTHDYNSKVNSFINDSRFKNNALWPATKRPTVAGAGDGSGCNAYVRDFIKLVHGTTLRGRGCQEFYSVNDIRTGDVIWIANASGSDSHWFVVLYRNGDQLTTAEGNWDGKNVVGDYHYRIYNGRIQRRNKKTENYSNLTRSRAFYRGYHFN